MHGHESIETLLANIQQEAEQLHRNMDKAYRMGLVDDDGICQKRAEFYSRKLQQIGRDLDENEYRFLREQLLEICKLRLVPYEYHPADLGFDQLSTGFLIFTQRLGNLEEMYHHPEPVGKKFPLKMKLKNKGEFVWVDYTFSVMEVKAGTEGWAGYRGFYGTGSIPGYNIGGDLYIKEDDHRLRSVFLAKVYADWKDPIWKTEKETTETEYRFEMAEK